MDTQNDSDQSFLFVLQMLSKVIIVENENRKYSYLDLVRTPRMRRLTLLAGIVWYIHFFGFDIFTFFIICTIHCPYH